MSEPRFRMRVRELAEEQGLTVKTLAAKSGLSERHVRRLWRGQFPRFLRFSTVERLTDALGRPPLNDLFTLVEEDKEHPS